jgi:hypothetical protein
MFTSILNNFNLKMYSGNGDILKDTPLNITLNLITKKLNKYKVWLKKANKELEEAEKNEEWNRPLTEFSKFSFYDYRLLNQSKWNINVNIVKKEIQLLKLINQLNELYEVQQEYENHEIYKEIREARKNN